MREARSGSVAAGESWVSGLRGIVSPASIGQTLASAFQGRGWAGAAQGLGSQAGSVIAQRAGGAVAGKLGGLLSSALGVALPVMGPLLGAAGAWIAGKLFGGRDEGEKQAEAMADAFLAGFGGIAQQSAEIQQQVSELQRDGMAQDTAIAIANLERRYQAAGRTREEAAADFRVYLKAVRDGNAATVAQLEADWAAMAEGSGDAVSGVADNVRVGADALTGHTEESLTALREAAVETFEAAGVAAEDWSVRTGLALDAIAGGADALRAMIEGIPTERRVSITLDVVGVGAGGAVIQAIAREVLRQAPSIRRDAGEAE